MHLVFSGGLPPLPLDLGGAGGVAVPLVSCLGRAGSLPLLLLFRGRAEWELPARCRLSVPRFRLLCLSLILTARSTTWEFGGDFVVLPTRFILPCFSFFGS